MTKIGRCVGGLRKRRKKSWIPELEMMIPSGIWCCTGRKEINGFFEVNLSDGGFKVLSHVF